MHCFRGCRAKSLLPIVPLKWQCTGICTLFTSLKMQQKLYIVDALPVYCIVDMVYVYGNCNTETHFGDTLFSITVRCLRPGASYQKHQNNNYNISISVLLPKLQFANTWVRF